MESMKRCPYCGEEILAVAVKCKHCGSNIENTLNSAKSQFKMRPVFKVALVVILLLFGAGIFFNWSNTGTLSGRGFTDADVERIEQGIRAEFSKREGIKVEEVKMIRESPRKMTGFATIRAPLIGAVHKSCSATMSEDGQTIWECT
jgi:hypothetical protein